MLRTAPGSNVCRIASAVVAATALHGGCASYPLAIPFEAHTAASITARCHRQADVLRHRAGGDFQVRVDPPFVVAGNVSADALDGYLRDTVWAAARALWNRYVSARPDQPIVILLFRNERSYRRYARAWFGDRDVPYFGYYRAVDNTLLMNIATGTGTLVHELTHALTAVDFPRIPDWFNEGFASLFEECAIESDDIRGHINWRLPTLHDAMDEGRLAPLGKLLTTRDFRGRNEVLNYAQARYFCMFLQERSRLASFYRAFRDGYSKDPTGVRYVRFAFDGRPLEAIDAEFRNWVTTLRYPAATGATHAASIR